ncbi:hypothetical protein I3843_14G042700 [Carya illinoinensis]|nr:hypothetical protein I3843_14G042700 [Carya illinoinensis]
METKTFPLELLTNDNYADWSVKMKNNLLAQGLWDIVETGSEPPKLDDHVVEYEAWRKMNDVALHAIQTSCGMDILSRINKISSAKIAWETLAEMFMELRRREDDYAALVEAVRSGDWVTTRDFLKVHPTALTARILVTSGGTVLHAAVDAEQEHIVEELVNMISEHDLAMQDDLGHTALHETAISGNHGMAECVITKNKSLVSVRNANGELPVAQAMGCGHKELARYLYSQTPFQDLVEDQDYDGASLLNRSIYARDLDMALDLMERCPRLAFALDRRGISPLEALAVSTEAFESENRLRLDEMKLVRLQFQQLLSRMCEAIPATTCPENLYETIMSVIFHAISRGNFEFVYQIVKANSSLLPITKRRGIFHQAVLHRQHRIFSLIYSLKQKNFVLTGADNSKNTILHMAGMLTEHTHIDHIRGAALQMQREVQWFKEVERICPLPCKEYLNQDGLTPRQLFTKDHQVLRKEGERWMKDTATSCTVVGALIITIMFAAAFTIPGGNNQESGLPILVHEKLFKLFIVTDSLSLFSSSTSVLMFLGILTSRYAEEDFLISLPAKMIIGLFALFFSIATMMIAFSAALLLVFHGKYRIVIPIIGLVGVPIILFVLMQFRLLFDMLASTYGSGIFDRKMKPWF